MKGKRFEHWAVIGQQRAVHFLQSSLKREQLSSAYLFHGPNAVGKRTTALDFLQTALCSQRDGVMPCDICPSCVAWQRGLHPDFFHVVPPPDGGELTIERIRTLISLIYFRPTLSRNRVALLEGTEVMNIAAANALLKMLEEPPENTILVLLTASQSQLPLTVRSRCQELAFLLVGQEAIYSLLMQRTHDANKALDISHLAVGRPGLALQLLESDQDYALYQDRARSLLRLLTIPVHERLKELSTLLPKGTTEKRVASWPMIDIWIWLLRDAAMIRERASSLLVHRFCTEALTRFAQRQTTQALLHHVHRLGELKKQLQGNTNPSLSIESFLVNV